MSVKPDVKNQGLEESSWFCASFRIITVKERNEYSQDSAPPLPEYGFIDIIEGKSHKYPQSRGRSKGGQTARR